MRIFIFVVVAVTAALIPEATTFRTSCNFRCQEQPNLLDHMYPRGCYCHSTCGGKLRCCRDKLRYCGSSIGGGGEQACMIPPKISRATIVGGEKLFYRIHDTITYECGYRYDLKGSATRTCIGRNIWSPAPPSCKFLTFVCSPPSIRNGRYETKKHYTTGDVITISCADGHELQGSETMRCSLNRWNVFRPSCIEKRCLTYKKYCSEHATCKNFEFYAKCFCDEGYNGDGWRCNRIPCYEHKCKSNEMCVDSGNDSGAHTCECKEGYLRHGGSCVVDPCFSNNCHANAACSVVDGEAACACDDGFLGNGTHCKVDPCFNNNCHANATCDAVGEETVCSCSHGFLGNGTYCKPMKCDPTSVHGADITDLCLECEEMCCSLTKIRECRICIHTICNIGEVCGEKSRVTTICSKDECYKNDDGFTVDAPDHVHCLDESGIRILGSHCCWIGE